VASGRFADEGMRKKAVTTFATKGRSPDQVAKAVLHAIDHDTAVVPVGAEAWAMWLGKRVAPGVTSKVGAMAARRARAQ
jgi:hypothetical protein